MAGSIARPLPFVSFEGLLAVAGLLLFFFGEVAVLLVEAWEVVHSPRP